MKATRSAGDVLAQLDAIIDRHGTATRTVRVLVEERRALRKGDPLREALGTTHALVGRSMGEAPGVDGGIFFSGNANPGDFVDVTLGGATAFDFFGMMREAAVVA